MSSQVEIVGVRHHSPACARLVQETLRRRRPAIVLIEGPADMNDRLAELLLPHEPPVAVFSYAAAADGGRHHASWSPFCAYSPEWVALRAGHEVGAEVRFMDLPAWDPALDEVVNRYADRHQRSSGRWAALARRMQVDDTDAAWDALFEGPVAPTELAARLRVFFDELRAGDEADPRDARREAFMARCVAWAARAAGDRPVVVVCGGFHAPALARLWPGVEATWPELPALGPGERGGSYVVPYAFRRLDAFVGYEAGMPSPAFYQAAWELGPERAAEAMLGRALQALRARRQPASPADALAASTLAQGLARLRGHGCVLRVDLLDGLAGALVKDALDRPLPWSRRGRLEAGTDPLLVAVVAALSGDAIGRLAPGTPRPPLVDDAKAELEAHGLALGRSAVATTLDLTDPAKLAASRVLHRLRLLGIPGVTRDAGPAWATDAVLEETWTLAWSLETDAALIEAAAYGSTLLSAAAGRLEEGLQAAQGRVAALAALLGDAALAGIHELTGRVVREVGRAVAQEPALGALGGALARLVDLHRLRRGLGHARGDDPVDEVVAAAVDRGLVLVERLEGREAVVPREDVLAVAALRDAVRDAGAALGLDPARLGAVLSRRAHDADAPPAVRGAALGGLWSMRLGPDGAQAEELAARAVRSAPRPDLVGELLGGLFCLAREQVLEAPGLVGAIDRALGGLDEPAFLRALPGLRLAFGWFPPAEKERLARTLLSRRGQDPLGARQVLTLAVDPAVAARGRALDAEVEERLRRFGLEAP